MSEKNSGNQQGSFFNKKNTAILAAVITGALILASVFSFFIPGHYAGDKIRVYVKYGDGYKRIAYLLDKNNLIRNKILFDFYVMITGKYRRLKAGEYEFGRGITMNQIIKKIESGDVVSHRIVVTEGSDIHDIADILSREKLVDRDKFISLAGNGKFLKSIGVDYSSAEGFLFPDTYNFVIGEGEEKIMETMYTRFLKKVPLEMKKFYHPAGKNLSGYSVLKMASIIERESKLDRERPVIASVFYNRMKSKEAYQKRLESCATVRYALGKKKGALTYKDLRVKSPYNTYIYTGLPPTPICNPGIESIEAAMNPADTDYKYFVVKKDGEHTFSETLEKHNRAKIRNRGRGAK